jgi:hypothetical protein
MGYNTTFKGSLTFKHELSVPQLARLQEFFGEDCRDHKEWDAGKEAGYIDLRMSKGYTGIEWDDETEKTYGLTDSVNVIIREMRKELPEFGLEGQLVAQGEEIDDRWHLIIGDDGWAHKQDVVVFGDRVTCPHCGERFIAEESA